MSQPSERYVDVAGGRARCRVWEKGQGAPVGFLAGLGGLPRWTPFLDRLSERRRVIAPSLPGFPGGEGFRELDDHCDWIAAVLDLLEASGLVGADLIGESVGGMLAAEAAAFCPPVVRRLVLVAPFGIFEPDEPTADPFAKKPTELPELLSARPEALAAHMAAPEGADPADWFLLLNRASEAAARILWPFGDRGLRKRLHRIAAPTLLVWGDSDQIVPASYAKRFVGGIAGNTTVRTIPRAGHLVDVDAPDALAEAVLAHLAG